MKRKQRGVTLTEVIITLLLLAILVTALTPPLKSYFAENYLKSAAESLYEDTLLARSNATEKSVAVNFFFQTGSNWCFGFSTTANCDCSAGANSCNLGNVNSSDFPNTSLSVSGFTAKTSPAGFTTQFSASRATASPAGTATFSSTTVSGTEVQVTINAAGMPKICSSTVGGYGACQ